MQTATNQIDAGHVVAYVEASPADGEARTGDGVHKKRRAKLVFVLGLAFAVALGTAQYVRGRAWQSTDNAQVEGQILYVSPRTSGQIVRVLVADDQMVRRGDVLVELDAADLDVKVSQAKAEVAIAEAGLESALAQTDLVSHLVPASLGQARGEVWAMGQSSSASRAAFARAQSELEVVKAGEELAQVTLQRVRALFGQGAVAAAAVDSAATAARQAAAELSRAFANVESARAAASGVQGSLQSARGRLSAAQAGPAQIRAALAVASAARATLARARATLQAAELNRSYATVRAPISGVVSRKSAEPGQLVSPEKPLLAVVSDQDLWVVANFKEDQIQHMHPGQPASIEIDAFAGFELRAHVASLSAASGSRFALLPPDNSSGNFVKVVQRVPVVLRLDDARVLGLRPGMSAYVRAYVGDGK